MAKLFKRGKIWHAWVRKRGGGVKRVSTLCTDKRAAETVLATLEREAVDPAFAATNRTTTQAILDEYYLSRIRIGRSEGTKDHVFKKAKHLVRLMPVMACDISHAASNRYVDARLKEWAASTVVDENDVVVKEGRTVRRTTIAKELRIFKAALYLAKKNQQWTGDPEDVIPEIDDDHVDGTRYLTPLELVGLATVLPPYRMAVIAYAAAAGCDHQAIWRARREDVSEDCWQVQIHGKKRDSRERPAQLPLPQQRMLVRWALDHAAPPATGPRLRPSRKRAPKGGTLPTRDPDLLFLPWHNMWRDLNYACAEIGIPPCNANDLRRTYGTWLRDAGVEPQLIGSAMGHKDSRMVERVYGKLSPDALSKLLGQRVAPMLAASGTLDDDASNGTSNAVRYACVTSDVLAASGAIGATAVGENESRNAAVSPANTGARGRNRTADTGIFNPPVPNNGASRKQATPVSGGVVAGEARAIGVLCGDGLPTRRVGQSRPQPWVIEATAALACLLAGVSP